MVKKSQPEFSWLWHWLWTEMSWDAPSEWWILQWCVGWGKSHQDREGFENGQCPWVSQGRFCPRINVPCRHHLGKSRVELSLTVQLDKFIPWICAMEKCLQHNSSSNHLKWVFRTAETEAELHRDRISSLSWKEDKMVFWWEVRCKSRSERAASLLIVNQLILLSVLQSTWEHVMCLPSELTTGLSQARRKLQWLSSSALPVSVFSQLKPDLFFPLNLYRPAEWCWFGQCWSRITNSTFKRMSPIPSTLRKVGCSQWSKAFLLNLQYQPFSSSS